jgi:hypothetical protein
MRHVSESAMSLMDRIISRIDCEANGLAAVAISAAETGVRDLIEPYETGTRRISDEDREKIRTRYREAAYERLARALASLAREPK